MRLHPRWGPGGTVLAAGFMVLFFGSGSRFAIGLLLKPMVDDLGWSRGTVSLGIGLFMVVSALGLPVAGRLSDRYSLRAVLAGGVTVSAVGIGLMSVVSTPLQAILIYGVVFGVGNAGVSITPIAVLVSRWFPHRMGLGNAVAVSGMAMGQLVIISLLASQLEALGWRGAFATLGIVNLVLVLPVVWLVVRSPPLAPDVHGPASDATAATPLSAILRRRHFWLLLMLYAICGTQDFFVSTHVVAFALDVGLEPVVAGNLLGLMGLFGLAGVLVAGAAGDARGPDRPTIAAFTLRIAVFALILASQSPVAVILFALLYGLTFWVTAPLTVVFASRAFGVARLGVMVGLISMAHQISGGLGAYGGALLFDAYGSYEPAFAFMLVLSVVGTGLALAIRGRPLI